MGHRGCAPSAVGQVLLSRFECFLGQNGATPSGAVLATVKEVVGCLSAARHRRRGNYKHSKASYSCTGALPLVISEPHSHHISPGQHLMPEVVSMTHEQDSLTYLRHLAVLDDLMSERCVKIGQPIRLWKQT